MKKMKFLFGIGLLFFAAMAVISCNGGGHTHDGHSHKGHEHETTTEKTEMTTETAPAEAVDKTGKEYTSAFICPMHCKGSGSAETGKCPVCGMDYVANETKAIKNDHEGHDHDDHEGHNH